jgi:hypothetical protein
VEVNHAAEIKAHAKKDLAGDVVERVIEKTEIDRAPSCSRSPPPWS